MPNAQLTLSIPDAVWISKVSRSHPNTRFRVLAATANMAFGVAQIEILGENTEAICDEFSEYDSVTDLSVLDAGPEICRVQVETTVPLLMNSLQDAGLPLEMPFEVENGKMSLDVTIPQQTLSDLGESLDKFGIQYTVERIQQETDSEPLLTDRQQWLLNEAIKHGYYDTPRRTTLVNLAEELDIAKSTCSEILHRVEERVLKENRSNVRDIASGIPATSD